MIARLVASNFRSLEKATVDLHPTFTVLVGANGSGKSAILRALDVVCGPTWPTLRSLHVPQDWTRFDDRRELLLRVRFRDPLIFKDKAAASHDVLGLEVRCRPYKVKTRNAQPGDPNFDFRPYGSDGKEIMVATERPQKGKQLTFAPLTSVPSEVREQAKLLFIDHRRSLFQHQPGTRGSILARLLAPARRELELVEIEAGVSHGQAFRERYQVAVEALRTPGVQQIEQVVSETARRTLGFMGSAAVQNLEVGFGFADPSNPFASLRLVYREDGVEMPAEELGLGVQSAIVVGIFEAFRQIGQDIGTVLIEEPEMYLHPQAQRYFYGLLGDLADTGACQIICSTHSPVFADVGRFESIRLTRRPPGGSTAVSAITKKEDAAWLDARRHAQKLLAVTSARSEAFFAHRVLLVEGPGDVLAVRMLADRLGHNLDAEGRTVTECGGKHGIAFVGRICNALSIPALALHDSDIIQPEEGEELSPKHAAENEREAAANTEISAVFGDKQRFVIEPSLEARLGIGRQAKDKPMRVAEALELRAGNEFPVEIAAALAALLAVVPALPAGSSTG